MKQNIIHSIALCLTISLLSLMMACDSREGALQDNATDGVLYLNIAAMKQTRATALSDNEKMHSVRVVILRQNGTVEHNRFYTLEGAQAQHDVLLKVVPSETKKIFLIANEESVAEVEGISNGTTGEKQSLTGFFETYTAGAPGFEAAVNNLHFAPDYSDGKPIPMSSVYDVDVPARGVVEKTFYVVRVATKFIVNFNNWRQGEQVTVSSFSISGHADKNYLMAHVNDSEQNRQLFKGKSWIEWLKEVADASSEDDSYATTEAAGWLKDYDLPEQADRGLTYTYAGPLTMGPPHIDIDYPDNSRPGVPAQTPVFYLPESKNLKTGEAANGEQEYTLTVNIAGKADAFVCPLPNLKALFRNTCVVVNVTMGNTGIEVDVIPYSEVTLDPIFGLDVK